MPVPLKIQNRGESICQRNECLLVFAVVPDAKSALWRYGEDNTFSGSRRLPMRHEHTIGMLREIISFN
ncbi:MAG: hypothetical protein C4519_18770 [Desulfobacteraceae bacterium]|nr:MAG: hypothetical protein C4519_18770 [Desulfobacteraceae bacterium]